MHKKMIALLLALLLALTGTMAVLAENTAEEVQQEIEETIEEEIAEEIEEAIAEEIEEEIVEQTEAVDTEAAIIEETATDEQTATEGAISTSDELEAEIASRQVIITSTLGDRVELGEQFELVATLVGFEHADIALQWQYNSGEGWQDVDGADGESIALDASEQTLRSDWRLQVTVAA